MWCKNLTDWDFKIKSFFQLKSLEWLKLSKEAARTINNPFWLWWIFFFIFFLHFNAYLVVICLYLACYNKERIKSEEKKSEKISCLDVTQAWTHKKLFGKLAKMPVINHKFYQNTASFWSGQKKPNIVHKWALATDWMIGSSCYTDHK